MTDLPKIKDLRSTIGLLQTAETADPNGTGTINTVTEALRIRAQIVPAKTILTQDGTQLANDVNTVTHNAIIRARLGFDIFSHVTRSVSMRDRTRLKETFRILGYEFLDDKRNWMKIDLQDVTDDPNCP